VLLQLP
jgi:hypothetical protein